MSYHYLSHHILYETKMKVTSVWHGGAVNKLMKYQSMSLFQFLGKMFTHLLLFSVHQAEITSTGQQW